MRIIIRDFLLIAALAGGTLAASASEWPTFRGDNRRSGLSTEKLAVPLRRAWVHQPLHAPRPAWPGPAPMNVTVRHGPLTPTLNFDHAFHVVSDARSVYFGSSADDAVYCLSAETGRVSWRFHTEGPVRLPPVLSDGKVYAGSDDGWLYCLDAASGKLKWKYRGGPADKRLPGNGRMISLFPVRSGIVVADKQVYFTVGLFPSRGVFLCALDASSGKEVYKQPLKFAAQGTMLATADRLIVPSGRTSYHSCDRKTGKPTARHGASNSWRKNLVGGSFAVLAGEYLGTGPSESGEIHVFKGQSTKPMLRAEARRMIVRDGTVFLLTARELKAFPAKAFFVARKKKNKGPGPTWSVSLDTAGVMVDAGGTIFTGGNEEVAAFNAANGKRTWVAKVASPVRSLAISNGRLFASLRNGHVTCFAKTGSGAAVSEKKVARSYPPNPAITKLAEAALGSTPVRKGYCLVLGDGSGQLAYEIASRSEFRVICRQSDPARIAKAREVLSKAGLYGSRIACHLGETNPLPYPRYFANLIVAAAGTRLPPAKQILRILRPLGGVVCIAGANSNWGRELPGWRLKGGLGFAQRGPLRGAGQWSHFYADPANTACSNDSIKPVPMDIQWFGRPGPARMTDRHKKGPAPLSAGGLLFTPGFNYITASDAYNGTLLWEKPVPKSARVGAFRDSSNIAAVDNCLLIAAGDACLVLDARSGKQRRRLRVPGSGSAWGYLASASGLVLGSEVRPGASIRVMNRATHTIVWRNLQPVICSTSLFANDLATGGPRWKYAARTGMIVNPTIAVGDGRVYFIESKNRQTLQSKTGRITVPDLVGKGAALVALELASGKVLLTKDVDLRSVKHILYLSYARGSLLVTGSRIATVPASETKGRRKPKQLKRYRYDLFGFDAKSGKRIWAGTHTPDYDDAISGAHGEQVQHPAIVGDVVYGPGFACHLATGKPYAGWKWRKSGKCATISTSRHCAFSRYGSGLRPSMFDLASGKATQLTTATRPGCWINIIPAGGLLLIPEASSGCTCPYPIQTSLGLCPAE